MHCHTLCGIGLCGALARLAGVPAFVKQIEIEGKVSKDPAEWPEDLRVREWPQAKEE